MPAPSDLSDAPWELLARHLAGEASAPERASLRSWVQADPQHLQLLTTVTRAWERAGEVAAAPVLFSPTDVEAAWLRFKPLLGVPPVPPAPTPPPAAPAPPLPPVAAPWAVGWWPVAAALAVAAGGGYLWQSYLAPAPPAATVSYAAAARRQLVRLPDSSRAWLHPHSRLRYHAAAGECTAQLTGEAYFNLAPGAGRSFVVEAGSGRVRVAPGGAALNVRAYAAEDSVEVTVARGQAWLLPPPPADSLLLPAGTRAALHAADAPGRVATPPRRRLAANQNFRSWQTDTLRFADVPVAEVARTLRAAFGTAVTWSSPGLGNCRFTGVFAHPRPVSVLTVLAAATASQLLPDGHGGYLLTGPGCSPPPVTPDAASAQRP